MVTFVCNSVLTVTLLHFLSIKCILYLCLQGGGGEGSCRVPHIVVYSYWLLTEDLFVAGQQLSLKYCVCMCVCMCVRACVRVCVRVCVLLLDSVTCV